MRKAWGVLSAVLLGVATLVANEPSGDDRAGSAVEVDRAHEKEWEIRFDNDVTLDEYARQLEFFDIEVAAVSKTGRVEYVRELTKPRPEKRTGQRGEDGRMYIGWKSGQLHAADRRLLRKAGVTTTGKELTHFFPREVQGLMEELEVDYAGLDEHQIELTRFQIRRSSDDGGYEFVVIDQRPPRPTVEVRQATEADTAASEP